MDLKKRNTIAKQKNEKFWRKFVNDYNKLAVELNEKSIIYKLPPAVYVDKEKEKSLKMESR